MPPFSESGSAFLTGLASACNVINIRLAKIQRDPVPGITDIYLDPGLVGSSLFIHTGLIQTGINKSRFRKRRLPASNTSVSCFPVRESAFVRGYFTDNLTDRTAPQVTGKLIESSVKTGILRVRIIGRSMTQAFHVLLTKEISLDAGNSVPFFHTHTDQIIHGTAVYSYSVFENNVIMFDLHTVGRKYLHTTMPPFRKLLDLLVVDIRFYLIE